MKPIRVFRAAPSRFVRRFWPVLCGCLLLAAPVLGREAEPRRFSLETEVEVAQKWLSNPDLDDSREDGLARLETELGVKAGFKINPHLKAALELEVERDVFWYQGAASQDQEGRTRLRLKRLYLDWDQLAPGLSLRLGRQKMKDRREWLFDKELDGARLRQDLDKWRLDLAVLRQLLWKDDLFNGESHDLGRNFVVAQGEYRPSGKHRLGAYAVLRDDHRGQTERQVFFGLRAHGGAASLDYWLDLGAVRGREDGKQLEGHAFDLGATRRFQTILEPSLTLGYAFGSGGRKEASVNRTFRQTGLQDNSCRFNGVEDFQMYGETLDPELSNIGITTLAVGIRPTPASSLDLVHHFYRQDVAVKGRVRGGNIRARTTGKSRDLGQAADLVFGYRGIPGLELDIKIGVFWPGDAYGHDADPVYSTNIGCTYTF